MSIKIAQNDFTRKLKVFDTLQKLPKNVRDLGKFNVAKGLKKLPKSNKSPNLVTLPGTVVYLEQRFITF